MMRWVFAVVLALGIGASPWLIAPSAAQANRTVVAGGLNAPRGLAFGPNGDLYVAEAGTGGAEQIEWALPFRTATVGDSGRILRIEGGNKVPVASGIQSLTLGPGAEAVGVNGLAFAGNTLYAVVGQMNPVPGPRETKSLVVAVEPNGSLRTVADLGAYERENDPDGKGIDSNPFDLAVGADGNLYVTDAGANALLRVTPGGDVRLATVWQLNPVPTGIAVDQSGMAHVSFLSPAPFVTGSARVDRIATSGEPQTVVPNLTMATDLTFGPDGALYVLSLAEEFNPSGPPPPFKPMSGSVLRVTPSGPQVVVTGLNYPTKLAFGPDGALYVTNNATFSPPGSGEVLKITSFQAAQPAAAQPASSPTPAPAAKPAAKPVAPPAPAAPGPAAPPAQIPSALPRTGDAMALAAGGAIPAAVGALLLLVGVGLRRRQK
jgi:sugar lactone lactonase YvrE